MSELNVVATSAVRDLSRFEGLSRSEALYTGAQVAIIGFAVVFLVLMLIWGTLAIFKLFFHQGEGKSETKQENDNATPPVASVTPDTSVSDGADGPSGETIAAITAAISVIMSQEHPSSRFRVVSFKRK